MIAFGVVYYDDVSKSNALYVERFASLAARPSLAVRITTKHSWVSTTRRVRRVFYTKTTLQHIPTNSLSLQNITAL